MSQNHRALRSGRRGLGRIVVTALWLASPAVLAGASCPHPAQSQGQDAVDSGLTDDASATPQDRQQAALRSQRRTQQLVALHQRIREADDAGNDDEVIEARRALVQLDVLAYGAMSGEGIEGMEDLAGSLESRAGAAGAHRLMLMTLSQVDRYATDTEKLRALAGPGQDPRVADRQQAGAERWYQHVQEYLAGASERFSGAATVEADLDEAAGLRECVVRYLSALAPGSYGATTARLSAADAYETRGDLASAEFQLRALLAEVENLKAPDKVALIHRKRAAEQLAGYLEQQQRWDEARSLRAMAGDRTSDAVIADLERQGKLPEAEALLRGRVERGGPDSSGGQLALNLARQRRYAEAADVLRPLIERSERASAPASMPGSPTPDRSHATVADRRLLGRWERAAGRYARAAEDYAASCKALRQRWIVEMPGAASSYFGVEGPAITIDPASCYREWLDVLWLAGRDDAPQAPKYRDRAFEAAQDLVADASGAALSEAAARRIAQAQGFTDLLTQVDTTASLLAPQVQQLQGMIPHPDGTTGERAQQAALLALMQQADALWPRSLQLNEASLKLQAGVPDYVALRAPAPIAVEALHQATGADARLLHPDEVLVQYTTLGADRHGLVFVVTREGAAWARAGLDEAALAGLVRELRAQIDPRGYGLPEPSAAPEDGHFDPARAYALYLALFSDPALARLLKDPAKTTLLFVPSGALTSFPLGLLVTEPPPERGSPVRRMRASAWLLRSKAISVLPTVASLRTLRQVLPQRLAKAPEPLLAFAAPDFGQGVTDDTECALRRASRRPPPVRGHGGGELADLYRGLEPLPCTRREAESLRSMLGGELLTGAQASEAELVKRNAAGTLERARVLMFATHGLVSGDFQLAEPALVLAKPMDSASREDGLLSASEIAGLKLNADWVILSACNTAAPDARGASGLSGLSRAFFAAGARSLLVSQWSLSDRYAAELVPGIVRGQQSGEGRAASLRRAALDILDHGSANPADWAVLTLVGDPD